MGPPRRGRTDGVRDEGRGVGAPTLGAENRYFGGKAVIYLSFFFGDEIFLYPPRVKLSGFFGRSDFLKCRGPGGDIIKDFFFIQICSQN